MRLVLLPARRRLPVHRLLQLGTQRGSLLGPALPVLPVLLARPHWTLRHLSALLSHLARERPAALLAATPRLNLLAAWACRLAGGRIRVLVSERTAPTQNLGSGDKWRKRALLPGLMRRAYGQADAVVAVSDGVADDLARVTGLPRGRIRTIYNPVVGPELEALSREPVAHPWLAPGQPPVVLSVARLTLQKDLPTLLRAFALLRAGRAARLLILGIADTRADGGQDRRAARSGGAAGGGGGRGAAGVRRQPVRLDGARRRCSRCPRPGRGSATCWWRRWRAAARWSAPTARAARPNPGRRPLRPAGPGRRRRGLAAAMARVLDAPPDPAILRRRAGEFTVGRAADAYLEALFCHG